MSKIPKYFKMFQAEVNQRNKYHEKVLTVSQDVKKHTQQKLKNAQNWSPNRWRPAKSITKHNFT